MEVQSDRRFVFPASRARLWDLLCEVERYPTWWPWLHRFDGTVLAPGERWHCVVQPPLPYRLAFELVLGDIQPGTVVVADVSGDLAGSARLELGDHPDGCEVRLVSHLSPTNRLLSAVATVAAPVVRFGHDWVLDTGARQVARALAD